MRAAVVTAALLAACASHERPPDPQATPREQLARALGLELPDCAGPDRPAGGRAVWISLDGIHIVEGDAPNSRTVESLEAGAFVEEHPNHLIGKLYDAVAPDETRPAGLAVTILADRRAPMTTVIDVLYTLGRAEYTAYHLACGSAEQPSALAITPRMFGGLEPRRDPPTVRAVRSDLALKWDASGARAWALPRRAEDPPFAPRDEDMFYDSALPPPREMPTSVPLVLEDGADPTLSPEAVAQLTATLCRFNDAPFGVELAPHAATPYAELLRLGAAATSRCGGPRQLIFLDAPEPRAGAMTVEGLKTLRRE